MNKIRRSVGPLNATSKLTARHRVSIKCLTKFAPSLDHPDWRIDWCQPAVCIAAVLCLMTLGARTASAQGVLTNGLAHDGAISAATETDTWTIAANQGDRITVQIAELSGGAGFTPMIEVYSPNGARLAADSDGSVARWLGWTHRRTSAALTRCS